jgi:hypothetical protein
MLSYSSFGLYLITELLGVILRGLRFKYSPTSGLAITYRWNRNSPTIQDAVNELELRSKIRILIGEVIRLSGKD